MENFFKLISIVKLYRKVVTLQYFITHKKKENFLLPFRLLISLISTFFLLFHSNWLEVRKNPFFIKRKKKSSSTSKIISKDVTAEIGAIEKGRIRRRKDALSPRSLCMCVCVFVLWSRKKNGIRMVGDNISTADHLYTVERAFLLISFHATWQQ